MFTYANDTQAENWFVARTRYYRQEIKIRDWLDRRGIEAFVPTQSNKPAAPNLVFLKTTKEKACSLRTDHSLPMQYIIDCATHKMLVVPDKQMEDFQRVFDLSLDKGGLTGQPLSLGDRVRIIKGPLRGVEGSVVEIAGQTYIAVSLIGALWAKARVPKAWLELA